MSEVKTLENIIDETLALTDKFEFIVTKSKAKDRDKQALRAMKQLRNYLNDADLNAFKIG